MRAVAAHVDGRARTVTAHEEEVWDAERVREHDELLVARGALEVHRRRAARPSGRLVALTEILLAPDAPAAGLADVTVVHPEHRGHRLGLAVKIANLEALAGAAPAVRLDRHRQRGGERADDRGQRHDGLRGRRRGDVLAEAPRGHLSEGTEVSGRVERGGNDHTGNDDTGHDHTANDHSGKQDDVETVDVSAIDPADADAFDEWFAVLHETDFERWPGGPGWQRAERLALALDAEGPEEHRCLVARRRRARRRDRRPRDVPAREPACGPRRSPRAGPLPPYRRRHRPRARARRGWPGTPGVPSSAGWTSHRSAWATRTRRVRLPGASGSSGALHMVRRRLTLPLDPAHEAALRAHPKASAAGYVLLDLRRPLARRVHGRSLRARAAHVDRRTRWGTRSSTRSSGTSGACARLEAALAAQNRAKVTTAARHEATGRIVAFTEVVVPLGAPESAWQHDTLVMREHRGHGLGFAMKVANLWAVRESAPGRAGHQHLERRGQRTDDRRQRRDGLRGRVQLGLLAQGDRCAEPQLPARQSRPSPEIA